MAGLLAKVQIARRQLALADDDYRAILQRITGCRSSKDCSERQLEAERFTRADDARRFAGDPPGILRERGHGQLFEGGAA